MEALWTKSKWCRLAPMSRTRYYTLPPEARPLTAKIAGTEYIVESPQDYALRMHREQNAVRTSEAA